MKKISENGILLIKHYEELHDGDLTLIGLQPKMCPAGIWTEGYGHAMVYNGKFLSGVENKELAYELHSVNDEQQASALLLVDVVPFENKVNALLPSLTQNQFDALVSFCYNLGYGALLQSTLLKYIKGNTTAELIKTAFMMWNKCNHVILNGLTYRRHSEADMFNYNELNFYNKLGLIKE